MSEIKTPGLEDNLSYRGAPHQQLITDKDGNAQWEDRLCYIGEPVETIFIKSTIVPFVGDEDIYVGVIESSFPAIAGDVYKVTWDNIVYDFPCVESGSELLIGDFETCNPFAIEVGVDSIIIYTTDTSSSHTFSISGKQTSIIKIPAKFIDKDTSGYIIFHKDKIMTKEEAEKIKKTFYRREVGFVIWDRLCIRNLGMGSQGNSDGSWSDYIQILTTNDESYTIVENSEGVFNQDDRIGSFKFPSNTTNEQRLTHIKAELGKITITQNHLTSGEGTTDALFCVYPNGLKSKRFEVLGNGQVVSPAIILHSSTANSTKKFRITVDDSGTISTTEVT